MKKIYIALILLLTSLAGTFGDIIEDGYFKVENTGYYQQFMLDETINGHRITGTINVFFNLNKKQFSTIEELKADIRKTNEFEYYAEGFEGKTWLWEEFYIKRGFKNCVYFDKDKNFNGFIFNDSGSTRLLYLKKTDEFQATINNPQKTKNI